MREKTLKKMTTSLDHVVQYSLDINGQSHAMNALLGSAVKIEWSGEVVCMCGRIDRKFYRSGFCYNCFWEAPQASQSIFKPELCTAHLDIEERDLAWEKNFQLAPHYVYLANSSGIKVGITRESQGVVRWMDQGASQAIILAKVPNRRFSGDIEVAIKQYVADKTNWRKMLAGTPDAIDMVQMKKELAMHVPTNLQEYVFEDDTVTEIKYPVKEYPQKVKSVKLAEKTPIVEGVLKGIKGQYLLLDGDRVFNVRAHEGYVAKFSALETDVHPQLF